jgi:hypothetical protein
MSISLSFFERGALIQAREIMSIVESWAFSMSKFAIGDRVDKATNEHEGGVVVAVFPTEDGNFRYAVDMEGYGALQFLSEEKLVVHTS